MADWDRYLREHQGHFGLRFGGDSTGEFAWTTIAQHVGDLQIVRFTSDPVDYSRSERDVRGDGDDGFRLMLPIRGEFKLAQRDSAEIFVPGKIAFLRWGAPVRMLHDSPLDALIMTVPVHTVAPDRAAAAPLALDMRRPLMRSLVNRMIELHVGHEDWSTHDYGIAYHSALDALEGALRIDPVAGAHGYAQVAAHAREIMELHADSTRLTPDAVAAQCRVSRRTLYSAVKDTYGVAPAELLREIRLDRAHRRLSAHGLGRLKEVARLAGYSGPKAFRAAFRRRFDGQSPEELFG